MNISQSKNKSIPWNKGIKYSDELKSRLNLSGLEKGRNWNKGLSKTKYKDCVVCGSQFRTLRPTGKLSEQKYCSRECYGKEQDRKIIRKCIECGNNFKTKRYEIDRKIRPALYCSRKCSGQKMKEFTGEKSPLWRGGEQTFKCEQCKTEFKSYDRKSAVKPRFCSRKCCGLSKVGTISPRRGIKMPQMSGENHHNWKGGIKYRRHIHTTGTMEYKQWRTAVFERDGYKCRIDNTNCVEKLQVHHILSWVDYPELRYDVNNGITLCLAHHPRKRAEEKRLVPLFKELVSVSKLNYY